MTPKSTNLSVLCQQFKTILLDVYGVLLDGEGAFPQAIQGIDFLNNTQKQYFILTNGSSKTVADTAAFYRNQGLNIPDHRVISSGGLLGSYFKRHELAGQRIAVMGTIGSKTLVADAGGIVVDPLWDADFDVLVVGNQGDFPFLESMDATLTSLIHKVEQGKTLRLILPNPDLLFPSGRQTYGFTAGIMALMLEEGLKARFGDRPDFKFARLGKPFAPIFEEAVQRAGNRSMVLIGDQLDTDVLGAKQFGIAAAIVKTGLAHESRWTRGGALAPDFILDSLAV